MIELAFIAGFELFEKITGRKSGPTVSRYTVTELIDLVRENDGSYPGDSLTDPELKIADWAVQQGYLTCSPGSFGTTDWYELPSPRK